MTMTSADPAPIAVMGATGNVGVELVRALRAAGARVRALSTDPGRARPALLRALALPAGTPAGLPPAPNATARSAPPDDPGLETVPFDLDAPAGWPAALAGARALFLLRPPHVRDTRRRLNPVADAAAAAGVRHVVFLSVQGAEGNALVPHHAVERHLRRLEAEGQLGAVLLRPAFFLQNLSTTHRAEIRDLGALLIPSGDGRTAFVDVRDVAAAAALALLHPAAHAGRSYELTGTEALTYAEVAERLSTALGRRVQHVDPGPLGFWRHRRALGDGRGFVLVMEALYATVRLGWAGRLAPDLGVLLGRAPITVAAFAREHAGMWRVEGSG